MSIVCLRSAGRSTSRRFHFALGAVMSAIALGCANDVVLGEHVATIGATTGSAESQTSEAVESNTSHDSTSDHPPHDGGRPLDNVDDRSDINDDDDDRNDVNPDDDGRDDFTREWSADASNMGDGGRKPPPIGPFPGEPDPRPTGSLDWGSEGIPQGTSTAAPGASLPDFPDVTQ